MTKGSRSPSPTTPEANSDSTNGTQKPGGTWPKVEELLAHQQFLESEGGLWLATCRALAERRLPPSVLPMIPEEIWRLQHWGSKVVIMRTPEVVKQGRIITPEDSRRPNAVGWIHTVGNAVCRSDEANVRGKECPYGGLGMFDPLLCVGQLVLFNPHGGKSLTTNMTDRLFSGNATQFILISIADVWGPLLGVKESDWSPEQEVPAIDTVRVPLIIPS